MKQTESFKTDKKSFDILKKTFDLFKVKRFKGVQPITLNNDTFSKKMKYFITYKLDGLRKLLLVSEDKKSSIISQKMEVEYFTLPKRPDLKDTVIDCELFNKKLYCFDILFYKGKDVRDFIFSKRILILKEFIKIMKSKKLLFKEQLNPYTSSLCTNFNKILKEHSDEMKLGGEVDGVIFTPDAEYKIQPLKWKPTEMLTIDFKIKKVENYKLALLTQNNTLFKPYNNKNIGYVRLNKEQFKQYKDDDIVEFSFNKGNFIPIRTRHDKQKPNHISVILSNYNTILNPPNVQKLIGCI